jgi:hypothetical protein
MDEVEEALATAVAQTQANLMEELTVIQRLYRDQPTQLPPAEFKRLFTLQGGWQAMVALEEQTQQGIPLRDAFTALFTLTSDRKVQIESDLARAGNNQPPDLVKEVLTVRGAYQILTSIAEMAYATAEAKPKKPKKPKRRNGSV